MGNYAIPNKRRINPVLVVASKLFSNFIRKKDYKSAAKIAYFSALKIGGVKKIMSALNDANSFAIRKKKRTYII